MFTASEDCLSFIECYNGATIDESFFDVDYEKFLKSSQRFNEFITIQELSILSMRNKSICLCYILKVFQSLGILFREAVLLEGVEELICFFRNTLIFFEVELKIIYLTEYIATLYQEIFPHLLSLKRLDRLCAELLEVNSLVKVLIHQEESKNTMNEERVEDLRQMACLLNDIFTTLYDGSKAVLKVTAEHQEEFEIMIIKNIYFRIKTDLNLCLDELNTSRNE